MVKKADLDDLFSQVKAIDTTPGMGTLVGSSQEKGEALMKLRIILMIQDWYSSLNTRSRK